jgi:hypothetical protein
MLNNVGYALPCFGSVNMVGGECDH